MPRKRVTPITSGASTGPATAVAPFDFETPFQRFNDPDAFAQFCAGYPKPEGTITYVYRLQPAIDRQQTENKDTAIEKVTGEVVDPEWLSRKWGSGLYLCMFNDSSRPTATQQVAKCKIEIDDPTLAPVLDPAELVVNEKNSAVIAKYLNLGWTIVEKTNDLKPNGFKQLVPPAPAAKGGNAEGVLAETVRDLAMSRDNGVPANAMVIDRDVLNLLLSRNKGGEDDLTRAFAIAERLRPPEDKTTQVLLAKMADALFERAKNPAAPVAPPAVDPVAQLRTTMQFLRDEMGWGGGSTAGKSAAGVWDAIAALPGILQHGSNLLGNLVRLRMVAPAGQTEFFPVPASLPVTAAPGPEVHDAVPVPETEDPMLNPLKLQAMIALGRQAVAAFEAGTAGDDFAETVCANPESEAVYDDLLRMGKPGILAALSMVPGLSEKLEPRRAEYEAWLDAFLSYGSEDDDSAAA